MVCTDVLCSSESRLWQPRFHGQSFVAWLPLWGVPASYAVAITYVLVDTYDKYSRAKGDASRELDSIDLDSSINKPR